jgi:hypothetical protein
VLADEVGVEGGMGVGGLGRFVFGLRGESEVVLSLEKVGKGEGVLGTVVARVGDLEDGELCGGRGGGGCRVYGGHGGKAVG